MITPLKSAPLKSLVCMMAMTLSSLAFAQDNPYRETLEVELPENVHQVYAGIGLANELMHVIVEKPTHYGNIYARVGQFYDGQSIAGMVGYRYPYKLTGKNNNGVYIGAFAGHVEDDRLDDERYNRLGAGIDISYLWFDNTRISSIGMGIYIPERKESNDRSIVHESEPALMFNISLAAGFF